MGISWTSDQLKAIYQKGNIIVSAGAGSGKTAVLSERVLQHILNDNYNIDELLVLTFTNAAAASMKNKIRNTILKSEELKEEEKKNQLNKIDGSYIMTFDAYALSLVKKYHYLLNVNNNIDIIDNGILTMKTEEFLNEIMLEHYKNNDPDFIKLISDFCVKDDNDIRKAIVEINHKLDAMYGRDEFVETYQQDYCSEESFEAIFEQYCQIIFKKCKKIDADLNELSNYVDVEKTYQNISEFLKADNYQSLHELKENVRIGRKPKVDEESSAISSKLHERIKKEFEEVYKMVSSSKEEHINLLKDTSANSICLLNLCQQLNKRLFEFKKENNAFDFIDISKMAISILDLDEDVRLEVKNYFKEILIDEYQDTNDLQEEFIRRIANNNVYMVGDIKQSIYRFRNANPSIFKDKYDSYKKGDGGQAIDLLQNFRSRKEVLSDINTIFDRLMDGKIGGADYNPGHRMVFGNLSYDQQGETNQNNHLEFLQYKYSRFHKEFPFDTLSQAEVEAFVIAKDIKNRIDSHYQVFVENPNTKKMEKRACQYSDFCILIDRASDFDTYKRIMTYLNIPLEVSQDEKMSDSSLMVVIKNLFKLVKCVYDKDFNYDFKYAYASIRRSFICDNDDSLLFEELKNNQWVNSEIIRHINNVCIDLANKSIYQILQELIFEFDIYQKLPRIADVHANNVKLDKLQELTHSLNQLGYSLHEFIEYLDYGYDGDKKDLTFNMSKGDNNAVQIMTIHKSKGLEFTICYFPGLSKEFNDSDKNVDIGFNKQLGVVIPVFNEIMGLKNTIKNQINAQMFIDEDTSEKIRLFYVALTRTREKMIAIGPIVDETCDEKIVPDNIRLSMNSFIKMLNPLFGPISQGYGMKIHPILEKDSNMDEYNFTKQYRLKAPNSLSFIQKITKSIRIKKLDLIKPKEIEYAQFSKNIGLINEETKEMLDFGTQMHYYLETLDFINPDYSLIPERYHYRIQKFLNSPIMANVDVGKDYREFEFVYLDEQDTKKHGVIDLLMEYDDHFDIIDYKLKKIEDENYDKQLNGYRNYIKSISNKKVNCYLYSIFDSTYRKVEE